MTLAVGGMLNTNTPTSLEISKNFEIMDVQSLFSCLHIQETE